MDVFWALSIGTVGAMFGAGVALVVIGVYPLISHRPTERRALSAELQAEIDRTPEWWQGQYDTLVRKVAGPPKIESRNGIGYVPSASELRAGMFRVRTEEVGDLLSQYGLDAARISADGWNAEGYREIRLTDDGKRVYDHETQGLVTDWQEWPEGFPVRKLDLLWNVSPSGSIYPDSTGPRT